MSKPLILVTNDDGIQAPGLAMLSGIMRDYGRVIVIAPQDPMSGMSHAVTVKVPLRIKTLIKEEGFEMYSCNGTPVDAVKLGQKVILHHKPDLVVAGINHGSNSAINILYSGTMAAVIEATIEGIPAVGFSLTDYSPQADFSACAKYVKVIVEKVMKQGLPAATCLNVNIPDVAAEEIRGIKICKQGRGTWDEEFDERKDPRNRDYYWLTGLFKTYENGHDTDVWALSNKYVSVVPVHLDFTNHQAIAEIKKWNLHVE